MFFAILGGLPIAPFNSIPVAAGKMLLLEWGLWIYLALFFVKNKWLKAWMIWTVFCLIFQYNRYSYAFANTILLYTFFYQVLENKLMQVNLDRIFNGICIIVWIHLIWMVLQWQGVWWFYKFNRHFTGVVFGLLANSNNAGMLLALSVPCFLRRKWCWLLPGVIGGIVLSQHDTSIIAVLFGLGIYVWIMFPQKRFRNFGILTILFLAYFKFIFSINQLYSITIRLDGWHKIIEVVQGSPIQGLGLGQFRNAFHVIQRFIHNDASVFFKAHNVPLQLLFEQGPIGFGLMLGFVCSTIERFLKHKTKLGFLAFIGLIIAIVGGLGHFTAQTTSIIIPVIYMAIISNQVSKTEGVRRWLKAGRKSQVA